ncbi:MAG: hypothetical protein IPN33_18885 [Saprospiraceae bacterium]|nr:hypothetical protein [Saprospiraceae bacterium]
MSVSKMLRFSKRNRYTSSATAKMPGTHTRKINPEYRYLQGDKCPSFLLNTPANHAAKGMIRK